MPRASPSPNRGTGGHLPVSALSTNSGALPAVNCPGDPAHPGPKFLFLLAQRNVWTYADLSV